jgi:hypothetical protein
MSSDQQPPATEIVASNDSTTLGDSQPPALTDVPVATNNNAEDNGENDDGTQDAGDAPECYNSEQAAQETDEGDSWEMADEPLWHADMTAGEALAHEVSSLINHTDCLSMIETQHETYEQVYCIKRQTERERESENDVVCACD